MLETISLIALLLWCLCFLIVLEIHGQLTKLQHFDWLKNDKPEPKTGITDEYFSFSGQFSVSELFTGNTFIVHSNLYFGSRQMRYLLYHIEEGVSTYIMDKKSRYAVVIFDFKGGWEFSSGKMYGSSCTLWVPEFLIVCIYQILLCCQLYNSLPGSEIKISRDEDFTSHRPTILEKDLPAAWGRAFPAHEPNDLRKE